MNTLVLKTKDGGVYRFIGDDAMKKMKTLPDISAMVFQAMIAGIPLVTDEGEYTIELDESHLLGRMLTV